MTFGQGFIWLGVASILVGVFRDWPRQDNSGARATVASESAQIITRDPNVRWQEGPLVIRKIQMKDGTLIVENWRPVIGKDGQPDLELTWKSTRPSTGE